MLLSGMVHLLGGGVYVMNMDILDIYCKCGFEVLMCENYFTMMPFLVICIIKLESYVLLRLFLNEVSV